MTSEPFRDIIQTVTEDNMNFEEFRALWEKYRDIKQPETLNEIFKKINYLPLNKIFDVRVNILIKNIKDF